MPGDNSLIIRINGSAQDFLDELKKVKKELEATEKVLKTTAKVGAAAFAGFASSIALTTKAFADYETALVGVGKTTGIEGKQLENLGKQFQNLSDEIPVATNELLGIAQAAGQLGVTGEKNLVKFTETVAKLGVATDLSGEQAATTLTRILNTTGEGIETIDTFGSVIVRLGNNFAATESEITRVANEIARATGVFDVSAAQAAALGAALRSVGVQAELGGSVVGKTFRTIDKLVREGGAGLDNLAKVAGTTGDQFQKTFEEDSVAGFQAFIEGLGRINEEGGSVSATLETFGLRGDEVNKILPILAKNSELVGEALSLAADETKNATALNIEAEKAFSTLGAEKEKLVNVAIDLASSIGKELAPTIKSIIVDLREFLVALRNTDSNLISNIASFLKWGAVIAAAVTSISGFLLGVVKISGLLTALGPILFTAGGAAAAFWAAVTGPIGIAVAGIAAVTAGVIALTSAASKEEPKTLTQINKELDELIAKEKELRSQQGSFRSQFRADEIKKEIAALKELREERIKATEDFGTGSLLIRPEAEQGPDLGLSAFGIDQPEAATIPLATEQASDDSVERTKKREEAKTDIIDKETQKRIDALRKAVEEQKAISQARAGFETEEEKALAERRAQIQNDFVQARKIKNDEERELALEALNLKHAEELAAITEQQNKIAEERRVAAENEIAARDFLREEEVANRELLTEEDLIALEEKLLSEEEIKRESAIREAERLAAERQQRIQDEQEFGKAFAAVNAFFRNQDVQNLQNTSGQLIQLTRSKNATLNQIGKRAAQVNAAISTAEGAIAAYKSLAGIPIVGPGLGAAAAAALVAFGVEQQQQILGANTGGLVPLGNGSVGRDSIPSLLTPGEIVAPDSSFDEVVEGTALARGFTPPDDAESGPVGNNGVVTVILEPAGDFIGMIEQKTIETEIQNTGVR